MNNKNTIENSFFDLIGLCFSFIISFFRSIKSLFLLLPKNNNSKFFNLLDFIFRKWSSYFWRKPSFYKITSFVGDVLSSIFKNK